MIRTKGDIVREIVKKLEIPQSEVRKVLLAHEEAILDYIAGGDSVLMGSVGKFQVKICRARIARNPFTGEKIEVPITRRVSYRFTRKAKQRVKDNRGGLSEERISSEVSS